VRRGSVLSRHAVSGRLLPVGDQPIGGRADPAHRKILAAIDALPDPPEVVVLDCSAIQALTVTVIDEEPQLDRELSSRGVTYWLAALNPRMLATAQLLPRWRELDEAGRVFPTALAAVRAYRARREHD
jgi:hypothetical protein